jgi:hypothetical protein
VQRNLDAAKSIFNTLGISHGVTGCDAVLVDLALREENISAAKTLAHKCLALSVDLHPQVQMNCLEMLGDGILLDQKKTHPRNSQRK